MKKILYTSLLLGLFCLNMKAADIPAFTLNTAVQGLSFEKSIDVNGSTAMDALSRYSAGADFVYGLRFIARERIPGGGFLNSLSSIPLHLSAGLGIHYGSALIQHEASSDAAFSTFENELKVPLFLRGKIDFSPNIISPFIACDGGYLLAFHSSDYGQEGWFVQPQFGLDIHSGLMDLYLAIGVDLQQSSHYYIYRFSDKYVSHNNPDKEYAKHSISKALCFHIGFRW